MYPPQKYAINLMWINRTLNAAAPYIVCKTQDQSPEDAQASMMAVFDVGKKWKQANPEAEVVVWYDSAFVTPEALQASDALLAQKITEDPAYELTLKDIRDIPIVRENPDVFSDNLPVYYRVDLLKLIICVHAILEDANQAAIFSDLEVGDQRPHQDRMGKEALFNSEIMRDLEVSGLLTNFDLSKGKAENQFFQVINKPETINLIKVYINACMSRAITALNLEPENRNICLLALTTMLYETMHSQLFKLLGHQALGTELLVQANLFDPAPSTEWVKYHPVAHGHLPLGNLYLPLSKSSAYLFRGTVLEGYRSPLFSELNAPHLIDLVSACCAFSRSDMETRPGRDHEELAKNLVDRKPARGESYQFSPWLICDDARASVSFFSDGSGGGGRAATPKPDDAKLFIKTTKEEVNMLIASNQFDEAERAIKTLGEALPYYHAADCLSSKEYLEHMRDAFKLNGLRVSSKKKATAVEQAEAESSTAPTPFDEMGYLTF